MRRLLSWMVTVMTGRAIADEDGFLAYEHGDYATAARIFRPLAEQSDALAQYQLATMYNEGKGVPKDIAEAIKWYRLAAEGGNLLAQNNLYAKAARKFGKIISRQSNGFGSRRRPGCVLTPHESAICMSTATSFR